MSLVRSHVAHGVLRDVEGVQVNCPPINLRLESLWIRRRDGQEVAIRTSVEDRRQLIQSLAPPN